MNTIDKYLFSFIAPEAGILGEIQKKAQAAGIPIVAPDTSAFLKIILAILNPREILEIGTATGFSASVLSAFGAVTTIEKNPEAAAEARRNFETQSLAVNLIEGDALDILKTLENKFDAIFLDAAKGQYIRMLDDCVRLLNPGGLLIADNVLQRGETARDVSEIPRKRRVIHKRMRAFLEEGSRRLNSVIVPVGDGIFLGVKNET
jgi:predicted O-methyltransferase YrrM